MRLYLTHRVPFMLKLIIARETCAPFLDFHFEITAYPVFDDENNLECMVYFMNKRKQLAEEHERMWNLSFDIFSIVDIDGHFREVNPAFQRILGYPTHEVLGKSFSDFLHPEDIAATVAEVQLHNTGHNTKGFENRYRCMDGSYRWLSWNAVVAPDNSRIYAVARDITDHKQVEESLRKNEKKLQDITSSLAEGIYVMDLKGHISFMNPEAERLLGWTMSELSDRNAHDIVHYMKTDGSPLPFKECRMNKVIENGIRFVSSDEVFVRRDGTVFPISVICGPVIENNRVVAAITAFRDITELKNIEKERENLIFKLGITKKELEMEMADRKLAEEKLFESSQMLQTVLDNIPQRIFWKDRRSIFLGCNKPFALDCGYANPGDLIGKTDYETASAGTAGIYRADDRQVMDTGLSKLNYEESQIKPDGSTAWLRTSKVPLRDKDSRVIGVLGMYEDFTERKLAKEALLVSEERSRQSVRVSNLGIFDHDHLAETIYWSPRQREIFGWGPDETVTLQAFIDCIHPEDRDRTASEVRRAHDPAGNGVFGVRNRIIHRDGSIRWVTTQSQTFFSGEGSARRPVRTIGAVSDITELKRAEEYLRRSENKYRTLIENLPQKIFYKDRNSVYISCNKSCADDLRIKPDEISGRTDYDFFPKGLAGKYREDDKRLMDLGKAEDIEEEYIQHGRERWIYTVKTPITDDSGNVTGILGISWDITERKKAEQQIKQSLREKETFLREIHHRVKNNMAVVSSLLSLQANKIEDATVRSLFEESLQRVKAMALVHEKLYQTKDLSSINFEDYITSIVLEIIGLYRIDTDAITTEMNIKDIELDLESAVPCGLIINELLANAFKHAFPDNRSGVLSINFTKTDDTYTLAIKDNGVGLPAGFDYMRTNTLGLQIVEVLTKQLRGSFQIKSDLGTEAAIIFEHHRK